MALYYSDDRAAQLIIGLLKAHGIKKIIANPGTTNLSLVGSVQNDPWFEVYSGIDERHSAYMAVGMASESGEAVVLSCTGATASRNYLPAMTEAYYRKLPVLVITSMQPLENIGQLSPQAIDRSVIQRDVAIQSYTCHAIRRECDIGHTSRDLNAAILSLWKRGGGPVHINLEMSGDKTFTCRELPPVRKVEAYRHSFVGAPDLDPYLKIAVFAGSGRIDQDLERFISTHNAVVFADGSSGYRGPNRLSAALLCSQGGFAQNPDFMHLKPDLIIDTGELSGDYPVLEYLSQLEAPVWRVSEDGEVRSRFHRLDCLFDMSVAVFARHYGVSSATRPSSYYQAWKIALDSVLKDVPELPFSNPWIAHHLSPRIPDKSIVHLGILNSLRSWNLFPPSDKVITYSNVGGFGIDGGLSTLIGGAIVKPDILHFGIFGDLAFFYDLNALGNRHIRSNVRLCLVNNGCGVEFNLVSHPGSQFGSQTNDYIAAGRHFGSQSRALVKHYAEDLGFTYLSASSKAEFIEKIPAFVDPQSDQPMVFECFTQVEDEVDAHILLNRICPYASQNILISAAKRIVPAPLKGALKRILS